MTTEPKPTPRLPEVGEFVRGVGTLAEVVTIPPPTQPPPTTVYVFEALNAQCRVLLNGKVFKTGSTYNDFYGLGSCVKEAIKDAKAFVRCEKIKKTGPIEVVVVKITSRAARLRNVRPDYCVNFYDKTFVAFENSSDGHDLPSDYEDTEEVVWSSRNERVAKRKPKSKD